MLPFSTILCAVDFSEHSRVALARAGAWARQFKARFTVVTVVEPLLVNAAAAAYDMDLVRDEVVPELRDFIEKGSVAGGAGIPPAEAIVLVGEPATEIVALARRQSADLIVVATHGLSGYRKMLLGSTTEKVLRQTTVPVLVAPSPEQTATTIDLSRIAVGRVLAPVDFKDGSVRDVRAAAGIAKTLDVPLLLVHVVTPVQGVERLRPHLDTHNRVQLERARAQIQQLISEVGSRIDIEALVAVGSPAEEIAQIAITRGAGLIVMGLRRQEHVFGPRPGSIAYRVLGLAPARVLALPSGETDAKWLRALSC
jgi:nucleotide-binding universal stress UspA family protein